MKKLYVVLFTILKSRSIKTIIYKQYIYKISRIDNNLLTQYAAMHNEMEQTYKPVISKNNTKISPNAVLIFKTKYGKCGHTLNRYVVVEDTDVNLTEEEFQNRYSDWEIIDFSEKQVVLLKEVQESCKQHYVIREKDGNLVVYIINDDNVETLQQKTNISSEYLTEADLLKLKDGIRVNGLEELNSQLEDFE